MKSVSLAKVIEKMNLKNLTPDIDVDAIQVEQTDINRPALQLTGFFEHFPTDRVQVIGHVENTYLGTLDEGRRRYIYDEILGAKIPCVIYCRSIQPDLDMIEAGNKYGVPILVTEKTTSAFMAEIIRWLNVELAPTITIHGVLVDVFGEGVLIMGESGIGKSEAGLELVKRGHGLVADDVVERSNASDET